MYVYSITCPLILSTSPAAILNLPINSFYPLDTVLVLTSDNLHLNFPPSPPPFPPSCHTTLWWHCLKTLMWSAHYRVYIYSLLIKKGICNRRNISSLHVSVFVCTFIRRYLHFWLVFPFFSYLLCLN